MKWFMVRYMGYGALGTYWALVAYGETATGSLWNGLTFLGLAVGLHIYGYKQFRKAEREHKDRLASSCSDEE